MARGREGSAERVWEEAWQRGLEGGRGKNTEERVGGEGREGKGFREGRGEDT